jgi:hypothetical protein
LPIFSKIPKVCYFRGILTRWIVVLPRKDFNSGIMKILVLYILLTQVSPGLNIRTYSATRHDRFLSFPGAPVLNPDFLHASTNLTGVGWYIAPSNTAVELRRQFTMVSPKHFVGAYHFRPSTSGSIRFVAGDHTVKTCAIQSVQTILNDVGDPSDLFLGTLEEEILPADGIIFHPFLSVEDRDYVGQELIFTGHENTNGVVKLRAGRGVFQARVQVGKGTAIGADTGIKKTEAYTWIYQENSLFPTGNPDDAHVEGGDSGSPSLVEVDGRGAIVGTHGLVGTSSRGFTTQTTSYDTFVPFYVDLLNAKMAVEGYHMTRAVPGSVKPSTTLTVSANMPEVMRAGYPASVLMTVTNSGVLENANNLKFSQTLPASTGASLAGTLWVTSEAGSLVNGRKGGMSTNSISTLTLRFTPAAPGRFTSVVTFSADEFSEATEEVEIEVIESYRSWSAALLDAGEAVDSDGDGIPNLHEYAFGGDPEVASVVQASTGERLLPTVMDDSSGVIVSFLQRVDADDRALAYEVEVSSSLAGGSWNPVTEASGGGSPSPVGSGFERVTLTLVPAGEARFYRLKVTLSE